MPHLISSTLKSVCLLLCMEGASYVEVDDDRNAPVMIAPSGDKQTVIAPIDAETKKTEDNANSSITITAIGNKLIITSEDPIALNMATELVRLVTQNKTSGDFQIIRLKHANAVETARIIDELFNGAKANGGGFGGRGQGGGGGPGADFGGMQNIMGAMGQGSGAAPARVERVRVVPDPATNALFVQASTLDMLTIRRLISQHVDAGLNDAEAIIKTFVIGPLKYANATDVAYVIKSVYRESMNNSPRGGSEISSPFTGAHSPATNMDANGNPKGVSLSLGVDEKTNNLIMACSTTMYIDVKKLVDQMEAAAENTKQTVKVVPIVGIDPALVQRALEAIQGHTLTSRGMNDSTNRGNSMFNGTGMGPGAANNGMQGGPGNFGAGLQGSGGVFTPGINRAPGGSAAPGVIVVPGGGG